MRNQANKIHFQSGEGLLKTLRLDNQCYAMDFFAALPLDGIVETLPRNPLRHGSKAQFHVQEAGKVINRYQQQYEQEKQGKSQSAFYQNAEKENTSKAQSVSYYSAAHHTTFFGHDNRDQLIGVKDLGALPFHQAFLRDGGTVGRTCDANTKAEAHVLARKKSRKLFDYAHFDEYKKIIQDDPQLCSEILAWVFWDFSKTNICGFKDNFESRCAAYACASLLKRRIEKIAGLTTDDSLRNRLLAYNIPITYYYLENGIVRTGKITDDQFQVDREHANSIFQDTIRRAELINNGKTAFLLAVRPRFIVREFFKYHSFQMLCKQNFFIAEILLAKYNAYSDTKIHAADIKLLFLQYCPRHFITQLILDASESPDSRNYCDKTIPIPIKTLCGLDLSGLDLRSLDLANKQFLNVSFRNARLPVVRRSILFIQCYNKLN